MNKYDRECSQKIFLGLLVTMKAKLHPDHRDGKLHIVVTQYIPRIIHTVPALLYFLWFRPDQFDTGKRKNYICVENSNTKLIAGTKTLFEGE